MRRTLATTLPTVLLLAPLATVALLATPAVADRKADRADGDARNSSLWRERESYKASDPARRLKAEISQSSGRINIKSTAGKGGGAAYVSNYKVDWTDGFTVKFENEFHGASTGSSVKQANTGIGFGFETPSQYDATTGFKTGVQVEIRQSKVGRRMQIVARRDGVNKKWSNTIALPAGAHDFRTEWVVHPTARTVRLRVFSAANPSTPILQLAGLEQVFSGLQSKGMYVSLFGYSKNNLAFSSSFDDFEFFGDLHSDSNDSQWCDSDDHSDDDDSGHGSGHGSGPESVSAEAIAGAVNAALALYPDSEVLEVEAEDGTIEVVLPNGAASLRVLRLDATTFALLSSVTRAADAEDQARIAALPTVTTFADQAALAAVALHAGAMVKEVELEFEDGGLVWEVELQSATGGEIEVEIPAQ
jgi:uncharacterized membrane protein YkoI